MKEFSARQQLHMELEVCPVLSVHGSFVTGQKRQVQGRPQHTDTCSCLRFVFVFFAECIRFGTAVSKNTCQSVLGGDTEPQFAPSNSFIGVNG